MNKGLVEVLTHPLIHQFWTDGLLWVRLRYRVKLKGQLGCASVPEGSTDSKGEVTEYFLMAMFN